MTRIAVVGAGIAGLNAALTLQDAGLACDIYEASNRVGGRMHSNATTWADDLVSEYCGEFIDADHETMRQLSTRFDLQLIDLGAEMSGQAQSIKYLFNRYYTSKELNAEFQAIIPILRHQSQATGFPVTYDRLTPEGLRLDRLSVYDWIEQYIEGGHNTALGRFLDTSCSGLYGLNTNEQSSLNLITTYGKLNAIASGSMKETSKIMGGNERLPQAIAHSLPAHSIHLSHRLTALEQRDDASLTLTFATDNGIIEIHCDQAILALPFSTLRHTDYQRAGFDALKQTAIEELGYGTISKLILQFDTSYWFTDGPWPNPNTGFISTDLDIQTLWDSSIGQTGSNGLLVNYTSGSRGAAYAPTMAYPTTNDTSTNLQQYAQNCLQQLEQVFPGISAHYTGRAALSYPTGDPFLLGSYACWRVGQYTHFAGYERVRQGSIHFAGEHCSTEFQGYMEGAAREGARAAKEIIQDLT